MRAQKNDARILSLGRHQNPDFVSGRKPAFASKSSKRHCIFFASVVMKTRALTTLFITWKSASLHSSVIFQAKTRYCAKWDAVRFLARPKVLRPSYQSRPPRNNAYADFTKL